VFTVNASAEVDVVSGHGVAVPSLWFTPAAGPAPGHEPGRRPSLTRERVVREALAVITERGVQALTMRSLATRLAVVPGALYRHVRGKEELYDLVLDEVLAEVDVRTGGAVPWTGQVTELAHRLRAVLKAHPGIAGLLTSRAPLTPHSLALAEAFLAVLHAGGLSQRQAATAYHLIRDYTVGSVLGDQEPAGEQRLRDPVTRERLREFLAALPGDGFPRLRAAGESLWTDDRDERFSANLGTLVAGLRAPDPGAGRP
jgi:TetR/AcrR family transcriptional regulator, tetracycline repressor protein